MTSAIQKHQPSIVDTLVTPEWSRDIIELVRKQTCPKGIPEGEFFIYMKKAQQSGLNPLLGEACCVPRKVKGPDGGEVTVFTFQPMAEGMRARAARFPDFKAVDGMAVHQHDVCSVDPGAGTVTHKFNGAANRGGLVGAWGRVLRKDGTAIVAWLPASARLATGPVWSKDPGGHLAKCAMVQALRQAYPVAFAGVYAQEEMGQFDAVQPTRAEVVLGTAEPAKDAPALPPPGPVVAFGIWKDMALDSLDDEQKRAAIEYAEEQVRQHPKMSAKAKAALQANVEAIRASMTTPPVVEAEVVTEREPLPISHPDAQPPEPGAEG